MVHGLPRNSAYGEALALDKDLVDPASESKQEQARPSMREWSAEVELLAAIFDRMNAFIQTQSEKDLRLKPWPSPLTAAEVIRQYDRRQKRSRLEALVAEAQQRARQQGS